MDCPTRAAMLKLIQQYRFAEFCLEKAWDQIILLQNKIADMKVRYDRAKASNRRSFQYVFKQRKVTVEKILKMYVIYTEVKAEEIFTLRVTLSLLGHVFDDELESSVDSETDYMVEEDVEDDIDDGFYIDDDEIVTIL